MIIDSLGKFKYLTVAKEVEKTMFFFTISRKTAAHRVSPVGLLNDIEAAFP